MPLLDWKCPRCSRQFEAWLYPGELRVKCGVCGGAAVQVIKAPHVVTFKPFNHPTLDGFRDVRIESKRQLAEEAERRGVYAPGIGSDAHVRRSKEHLQMIEAKRNAEIRGNDQRR